MRAISSLSGNASPTNLLLTHCASGGGLEVEAAVLETITSWLASTPHSSAATANDISQLRIAIAVQVEAEAVKAGSA